MVTSSAPARQITVLVADDDEDLLQLAVGILRREGYAVVAASDGTEALAAARTVDGLDVLFTDVAMPGRDGIDVAIELAATGSTMGAVFASGSAGHEARALAAGLDCEFLLKPYSPSELRRAIAAARPLVRRDLTPTELRDD